MSESHPAWAAPLVGERSALFHALSAAGFTPRDRNRPSRHGVVTAWYFRSRGAPALAGHILRPPRVRRGTPRPPVYLDHHECWRHPDVRGAALITWHIHHCLHPELPPRIPEADPHHRPPEPYPTLWAGPSWYWPRAIVGLTFHPGVADAATAAVRPFLIPPDPPKEP